MFSSSIVVTFGVAVLSAIFYVIVIGYQHRLKIAELRKKGMVRESFGFDSGLHFCRRRQCQNGVG
jgi:cell division protein FtsL